MIKATLEVPDLSNWERHEKYRIVFRALRRTVKAAKSKGKQRLRKELSARARDIEKAIKPKVRQAEGEIRFTGWSLPLDAFSPRKEASGEPSVKVKGKRRMVKGHFLIRSSRGASVARRTTDSRYPLAFGRTTGVAAMASNEGFLEDLTATAEERWRKEIIQAIEFQTLKAAGVV